MIIHKSNHIYGLDSLIMKYINNKANNSDNINNYYFFIWDYCYTKKLINDFYINKCNKHNTWNYNLKFKDTQKDMIQKNSHLFGFGNYDIKKSASNKYIIKAKSHLFSDEKYGQCQIIKENKLDEYNNQKYVIQPLLQNINNEELNVFVFKNLNTNNLHFFAINCTKNTNININRKFDTSAKYFNCDINNFLTNEMINNLSNYCRNINLDYGRIELINDIHLGWCVIDINNSPGGGPVSNMAIKKYVELFNSLK